MKKESLYQLLQKSESTGLLCNQSCWDTEIQEYTFNVLSAHARLTHVFIPEHGLFGELQDQVKLDDTSIYKTIDSSVKWISLYNSKDRSLTADYMQLSSIDTLVIDIQDTGSRYYTFASTVWLLLKKITELNLNMTIVVMDKFNPAGRQVEGTRINSNYASFIGVEGLPHRHGLTMGELCHYFKNKLQGKWDLIVVPAEKNSWTFVSPSPNIPTVETCTLYSGQCLWEGTNMSEGRGTTLPFATIGAPFVNWVFDEDWKSDKHPAYEQNCSVRPLIFTPIFHKYINEACAGIQLMPKLQEKYHSLQHSLRLIKYVKEKSASFEWRPGTYEALNDKIAIELLVGDPLLLDYLNDKTGWKEVKSKMDEEENSWIKEVSPFLIYKSPLEKLKIK